MDNDKKNQKVLLRKNLICYFLAMAKGQEAVQQLQEELVMHPYFNPILIFKKISKGHMVMTHTNFKEYLMTKVGITSIAEVEAYMRKHQLEYIIECEQFIATLLPYAPDVLRNSQATIIWQVKSSPALKTQIEQLYKQLVKTEIAQIVNIAWFRKKIPLTWPQVTTMIIKDFKNNGTILQNRHTQSEIGMVKIRRWMELWIQIREKDVLDVIRWIGGEEEDYVRKCYNLGGMVPVPRCTCGMGQDDRMKLKDSVRKKDMGLLRSFSVKPMTRKQLEMYERKVSYMKQQNGSMKSISKGPVRSRSLKTTLRKPSISQHLFKQPQKGNKKLDQKSVSLWCQYIYTILSGEKALTEKRIRLKPHLDQALYILNETVMSKKKAATKITKIISFIEKYIEVSNSSKKHLQKYLSHLSMTNDVMASILSTGLSQKNIPMPEPQPHQTPKTLKTELAEILLSYCQIKSKLIQISRQLIAQNLHQNLYKILNPTNSKFISRDSFGEILNQMEMAFDGEDVDILMRHFGDGHLITQESFFRVFQIQGN